MRLDGKTTTELTDSSGFEFNTTRPRSQCALEYNTSWSQSERARSNRGNTVSRVWLRCFSYTSSY